MENFTGTTTEFATLTGVEYAVASQTLKFLTHKGIAKTVGQRPQPSGKGKPSTIFEVPTSFTVNLAA